MRAKRGGSANDDHRDQGGNQRIFDCSDSALIDLQAQKLTDIGDSQD